MCCLRADQIEKTGERPTKVFMGRSPVSRLSAEASDIPDISDVAEKMLRLYGFHFLRRNGLLHKVPPFETLIRHDPAGNRYPQAPCR